MFSQVQTTMKTTIPALYICLLFLLMSLVSCEKSRDDVRETIDLSGEWSFAIDRDNVGLTNAWSNGEFQEVVELPGIPDNATSGPVWYSKKVNIPEAWKGKSILFLVERTKNLKIWVDDKPAGESDALFTQRCLDLTSWLNPGEHTLTVRIDQSLSEGYDPVLGPSNTMLGNISLVAVSKTHITEMQVTPQLEARTLSIRLRLANPPQQEPLQLKISLHYLLGDLKVKAAASQYRISPDSTITVSYVIKGRMPLWDEFKQPLMQIRAQLSDEKESWFDVRTCVIGLKNINSEGASFVLNDRTVFLKGYVENGSQNQSATAMMEEGYWQKRFDLQKKAGFNHCRFDAWCPPEAAFRAADKRGMYLQVDLPEHPSSASAVLSDFAHHPSLMFFASGTTSMISNPTYAHILPSPVNIQTLKALPFLSVKADAFNKNSGLSEAASAFATLCYRTEIEAAFRTPGLSGYQFPEYPQFVNDDPLMWQQFNGNVIPLLITDKYCWSQSEVFQAGVEVVNVSGKTLPSSLKWSLSLPNGETVKTGTVAQSTLKNGHTPGRGNIEFLLYEFDKPVQLTLTLEVDSTEYKNEYSLWVYPNSALTQAKSVLVSSILNKAVMNQLEAGGRVLLIPTIRSVASNSYLGTFFPGQPEHNNANDLLGLHIQSDHPIFSDFPTESFANWQWMNIVSISRAWNLTLLDSTYKPIIQFIDHPKRGLNLGLICEFKVGAGRLLVCTSKLYEITDKPEAVQLYNALVRYVQSADFNPTYQLSPDKLKRLMFYTITSAR